MHRDIISDYAIRIARAVALIEQQPAGEEPPDLAELADAAAFSPFHFHRVFRLMTGETVGAAVRRIRLARSLADLTSGTASITQAAAGSGYATSQAFARAMRQTTGTSARNVRANPALAERLAMRLRSAPESAAPLGIEVVCLEPFRVAARRRDGPYETLDEGYDALFEAVFAEVDPAALAGIWGVPLDDPFSALPHARRFDCALDIGDIRVADARISSIQLGGGRTLSMEHVGSYDAVHSAFDALYREALRQGHELAEAPPLIHYHDQPDEKPEAELRATLHLPLAPE